MTNTTCRYCETTATATATVHLHDAQWTTEVVPVCTNHADMNAERG